MTVELVVILKKHLLVPNINFKKERLDLFLKIGNYMRLVYRKKFLNQNRTLMLLSIIFIFSQCVYIQNQRLKSIEFPETPYHSGFLPGRIGLNDKYAKIWCEKYCEYLGNITQNLPEKYYLEIRGKMDATELSENREIISLGRAESVLRLLVANGISEKKIKAISDPEPNQYLGKDKFDPANRTVRFRILELK